MILKFEAISGFKLSSAGTVELATESEWKIVIAEFVVRDLKCVPILGLETSLELDFIESIG